VAQARRLVEVVEAHRSVLGTTVSSLWALAAVVEWIESVQGRRRPLVVQQGTVIAWSLLATGWQAWNRPFEV